MHISKRASLLALGLALVGGVSGASLASRSSAATTKGAIEAPAVSDTNLSPEAKAFNEYRRAHFPPAQGFVGRGPISEDVIVTNARLAAQGGETPAAPNSAAAKARLMRLGDFDQANGQTTDPILSPDRTVWVVTVHAPTEMSAAPGDTQKVASVYTIVFDAVTGFPIEKGANVDFVK